MLDPSGTSHTGYDLEANWGLSTAPGGTPGSAHTAVGTIYKQWRRAAPTGFSPAEQTDDLISGPSANPDADSSSNALEYATGTSPNTPGADPAISTGTVTDGAETYATLTYRRRTNAPDLQCVPEATDDLSTWTEMTIPTGPATDNGDGTETITVRDTTPASPRRLVRLRVVVTIP
jgi:hypothetical protein